MGEFFNLTFLPPRMESQFQREVMASPWATGFRKLYGEIPNLNDPEYDYRGAWLDRAVPNVEGGHWPSKSREGKWLKGPNHPTRWMEEFMTMTGHDPQEFLPPRH